VANKACGNDVAKFTAASCIFPHVTFCATQIKSLNMMGVWYFHAKILEKSVMVFG
jgi:hypothetical protein